MRLVHHRDGTEQVLANDAERADTLPAQMRGLMFQRSLPTGYGLVFPFESSKSQTIHMLFVFRSLDVLWIVDDEVTKIERLRPWVGFARGLADTVVELPAGAADGVEPGDTVKIVE